MAVVVIVGCGAMGSVYAGLMADAGHEVHAVCRRAGHTAALRERGLRVTGHSGDRTVGLASAVLDAADVALDRPADLVVVATKAYDVAVAARSCAHLVGPGTVVQTIQNGLGSPEVAAAELDPGRIAVGVVGGFGASLPEPGVAHHNGMEMVRFGPWDGLPAAQLEASAEIWRSAGFGVALCTDLGRMVWEKLVMNAAFSGTTCLTGLTIGGVLDDPDAWAVARACAEEAVAVAQASGVTLQVGDPVEHVRRLGGAIPHARPSMLLDALARHRCEVDAINGAVAREGARLGVPTPVNDTVARTVRARERTWL
ncbi:ketopantoate reductase family protein [Pseudonocardia alni]|uniref:ketopantoate reductase family protein n=1 Tax=Pseudonocardia alni TaxID=33907 RepID=UPI001AD73DA3|nr:2-dehydropantoate 2-reductase [Pseudonocardia alni]MBO4241293.1 2-dehydropantoate 2-reductase [Pseudonocardia alni]